MFCHGVIVEVINQGKTQIAQSIFQQSILRSKQRNIFQS